MIISNNQFLELLFYTYTNELHFSCTLKRTFSQEFPMFHSGDIPASDAFFPRTIIL